MCIPIRISDYYVELTITDNSGNSNSAIVTVNVIDTLSIEDFEISAKNIKLYPVPAEDYLFISTKLIINKLTIYDLNGKQLETIKLPTNRIDLTNLSAGVYFLKFNIDNVSVMKRAVKH